MNHGRSWIKIWVDPWLSGSMRFMTPAERGLWADLLALAGHSRHDGIICAGEENGKLVGYPLGWLAATLNMDPSEVQKGVNNLKKGNRITVQEENNRLIIYIVKWRKYQNNYDKQARYKAKKRQEKRKAAKKSTGMATAKLPTGLPSGLPSGLPIGYPIGYLQEGEGEGEGEEKPGSKTPFPSYVVVRGDCVNEEGSAEGRKPRTPTPRSRRAPRQPKTTLPDDFLLTAERIAYATSHHMPAAAVSAEFADFREYHTDHQTRHSDWDLTWHNWVRISRQRRASSYGQLNTAAERDRETIRIAQTAKIH